MTLQCLTLLFLGLLVMQGGTLWILVRRWRPQVQACFLKLHPFQKMALAVSAFGLATAYLFAFAAGAFFGGGHMAPTRCFTIVALKGDQPMGSTLECLEEKNDGLSVPLPPGVTRVVILDKKGRAVKIWNPDNP